MTDISRLMLQFGVEVVSCIVSSNVVERVVGGNIVREIQKLLQLP